MMIITIGIYIAALVLVLLNSRGGIMVIINNYEDADNIETDNNKKPKLKKNNDKLKSKEKNKKNDRLQIREKDFI